MGEQAFDRPVFEEGPQKDLEAVLLKEWFKDMGNISTEYVSREDWQQNYEQNPVVKNFDESFSLFLPEDLLASDLPGVIKALNEAVFPDGLPEHASYFEIIEKIESVGYGLLDELQALNEQYMDVKEEYDQASEADKVELKERMDDLNLGILRVRKGLKVCVELVEGYFDEENQRLEKLKEDIKQRSREEIRNAGDSIAHTIMDFVPEAAVGSNVAGSYAETLEEEFYETGIEAGAELLFYNMMEFSQDDLDAFTALPEEQQANIILFQKGRLSDQKDKDIKKFKKKLAEEAENLGESIGISEFKAELEALRVEGDLDDIAKKEMEAATAILQAINTYPWTDITSYYASSSPGKIAETKEIICVGKSILAWTYLKDLGIKTYSITMPDHSALEIETADGEAYFYDPTNFKKPKKFKVKEEVNGYEHIELKKAKNMKETYVMKRDPEQGFQIDILANKGFAYLNGEGGLEQDADKALICFEQALKLSPGDYGIYVGILQAYMMKDDHEAAYDASVKLVERYPLDQLTIWKAIGKSFYSAQAYDYATKSFEEALKLESEDLEANYYSGIVQFEDGNFEGALDFFMKVYEEAPENPDLNAYIGNTYLEMGDVDKAKDHYKTAVDNDLDKHEKVVEIADNLSSVGEEEEAEKYYALATELGEQQQS